MADLGKVMITPRGQYIPGLAYKILDTVSHNGSSYLAIKDTAVEPSNDGVNWMLVASKGDTGGRGERGEKGEIGYPDEITSEDIDALESIVVLAAYEGDVTMDDINNILKN